LRERFAVEAFAVRDLGLLRASDEEIFDKAVESGAMILTKDADFARLRSARDHGPGVVWLRIGNTSNRRLQERLGEAFSIALGLLADGEAIVEIRG
jgi:predicted nuclease of predicted toxin-antitoxin system